MHFYDFNIGDYAKKTQHLTNDEDLAYRRLLDLYYDSEKPITHCLATLSRRLRIDEKSIKNVIDEFFPDGINKHADEKIAEYHAYLAKQSENGKKGGRPKNQDVTIKIEDETKPTDNPPLSQNNPVPSQPLTTNHEPLTNINTNTMSPPATPKADPIQYEEIVNLYHQTLPMCPKVVMLTSKRKGQIAARWKSGNLPDLQTWSEYFKFVSESPFLTGKTDPINGHKRFVADLEWITTESNFTKIAERKYHGKV
jgi:uncharacterized protein YdaU (DUF1376 family)